MVTVTVSMFGDRELDVPADEVDVLRGQGILTSVDGVAEADRPADDANVLPAAEVKSAGAKEEATPSGGATPSQQSAK